MDTRQIDMFPKSFSDEILQVENLEDYGNDDAFELIGRLIDLSDYFNRSEGTDRALKLCEEFPDYSRCAHLPADRYGV